MAEKLKQNEIDAEVINARFLKPLDKETIKTSIEKTKNVITMEDGTEINGLGTAVEELIVEENLQNIKFKKYAWPDEFIRHGSVEELEKIYCDFDSILEIKNKERTLQINGKTKNFK